MKQPTAFYIKYECVCVCVHFTFNVDNGHTQQ